MTGLLRLGKRNRAAARQAAYWHRLGYRIIGFDMSSPRPMPAWSVRQATPAETAAMERRSAAWRHMREWLSSP